MHLELMRRHTILTAAVLAICAIDAPAQQSPRIASIQREVAAGHTAAVPAFWKQVDQDSAPLIERLPSDDKNVLATFLFRGDSSTKSIIVDARLFNADPATGPRNRMQHIAGTDIWYLTTQLPADAEFLYQLWVNPPDSGMDQPGNFTQFAKPDPLNPLTYPEKDDPLYDPQQPWRTGSIARMPRVAANPWLLRKDSVTHGAFAQHSVQTAHLKAANPRTVWTYTTPGALTEHPNVLILFDGNTTYQSRIPTPTILDNLFAAHKIGPTIVLFVDNGGRARNADLNFSDEFLAFLTDDLLPWAQREFHFTADPAHTALGGDSICGLFGAYAAFRHPEVFGEVLGQSAALQFNNSHDTADSQTPQWIVRQFEKSPKLKVKFYLEVGLMEDRTSPGSDATLLNSNRRLRDVLTAKGYDLHYREVYADHDPLHWRRTLPDGLMVLLAAGAGR